MSGVEFETDDDARLNSQILYRAKKPSVIASIVMKLSRGYITDESTANVVAFVVAILIILVALFVIPNTGNELPREDIHTKNSADGTPYYPTIK